MFTGTYIGGSVNLNAVALQYGVAKNGTLFAAINAADNIITTIWIVVTMLLPSFLQRRWPRKIPSGANPAIAGATAVLIMMLASLTLLPALLGFVGATRIFKTTRAAAIGVAALLTLGLIGAFSDNIALVGIGSLLALVILAISFLPFSRPSMRAILRTHATTKPREQQFWYRWSRMIQHRPWHFLGVGFVLEG